MSRMAPQPVVSLERSIARQGYAFLRGADMHRLLSDTGALTDWGAFAQSWEDMPVDSYMADGGRYRRRRHGVFAAAPGSAILRQRHQPHYQSRDYNPIHGGIERWFEPIAESVGGGDSMQTILRFCRVLFESLDPTIPAWHIEVHQFRIEARAGSPGKPTPEGLHRDGVDYVMVLLIRRQNIKRGTTTIHDLERRRLGSFTLTDAFDAALVHDARVFHGVTPVEPLDLAAPAWRDVLVVTFRRA
jgi:hypothetical protein